MKIEVYTDGSCIKRGNIFYAGYSVYFPNKELKNISHTLRLKCDTNQKAELYGILTALRTITKKLPETDQILIKTDSMYCINCITDWYKKWESNNWQTSNKTPVANKDIIKKILAIKSSFKGEIILEHVKGHSTSEGNNMADKLAREASLRKYNSKKVDI